MRQLGSGSQLENIKSNKSIDRDTPTSNNPKTMISQSAPHTPVSVPNNPDGMFNKSVPRLLSEPIVGQRFRNSSPGVKSLDSRTSKTSPFLFDKKLDNLEVNCDGIESYKSNKNPNVPVHSPKGVSKKESKFFLKSPLVKRETKVQIENSTNGDRKKSVDGTDV